MHEYISYGTKIEFFLTKTSINYHKSNCFELKSERYSFKFTILDLQKSDSVASGMLIDTFTIKRKSHKSSEPMVRNSS